MIQWNCFMNTFLFMNKFSFHFDNYLLSVNEKFIYPLDIKVYSLTVICTMVMMMMIKWIKIIKCGKEETTNKIAVDDISA